MSLTARIHQISFCPCKDENLAKILKLMSESDAYLDVFPEYDMGVPPEGINKRFLLENAESLEGKFVSKIVEKTFQKNSAVVFTTFLKEDSAIYNTAILAEKGKIRTLYSKIHLFDAFGYKESAMFAPGQELAMVDFAGFRLGLAVCFDLRFPEMFRAMAYKGVNLFVVPAGWYKGKYKLGQWRALILARAHENVSYLVAADQSDPFFIGHSTIASPLGYFTEEIGEEQASFTSNLDLDEITKARNLLPTISLSRRELYDKFYE
jgi:predicted amidohydrolase